MRACLLSLSRCAYLAAVLATAGLLWTGCVAPIGAQRVSMRQAYPGVHAEAVHNGNTGPVTQAILRRYNLEGLAAKDPEKALRQLHAICAANDDRNALWAMAELSYAHGDRIARCLKLWDRRDPRDYFFTSAVYAWLFLFSDAAGRRPEVSDPAFREASVLYNCALGQALAGRKDTNGTVRLTNSRRRFVNGREIQLIVNTATVETEGASYSFLLTDKLRPHGFRIMVREPGLGAPLVCAPAVTLTNVRAFSSATALLRGPESLRDLESGDPVLPLEIYPGFGEPTAISGTNRVPLEIDLTTHRAFALNDSRVWRVGRWDFLRPSKDVPNQLILNQPHEAGRVPVVFVHGTFSSPVTWAQMVNALTADPVLRRKCEIWSYVYGSGSPLMESMADLRAKISETVTRLDPNGTNEALKRMVIIGHSQGGLLAKGLAVDSKDKFWRIVSTNKLENLDMTEAQKEEIRRLIFFSALPSVKRVVFIATPHRGSYRAGGFVRRLARRLVSLPGALVTRRTDILEASRGSEVEAFLGDKMPTSLDGMSPRNPGLLAMADIAPVPAIKSHSIIAVGKSAKPGKRRDGVVSYESAHVSYVKSEFIVRSGHSCLNHPATIGEVRRILHEHLEETD